MHARLDRGQPRLLTRTGLDWTAKYPSISKAQGAIDVREAYTDGELCALADNGISSFGLLQAATDNRQTSSLIFLALDLLYLDGANLMPAPLADRKQRLEQSLEGYQDAIRHCDHQVGLGPPPASSALKVWYRSGWTTLRPSTIPGGPVERGVTDAIRPLSFFLKDKLAGLGAQRLSGPKGVVPCYPVP